jgi:hypothetical protein
MQIPGNGRSLADFLERHRLKADELVDRELIAIRSISIAIQSVETGYSRLSDSDFADPAIGLLLNLLHRNCELVESSVVAFVTGSGAGSEVISRASLEASANIAYIVSGKPIGRMLAYFDHYFRGVDRQVKGWRREIARLTGADAKIHELAATRRQQANDVMRDFVEHVFGKQHLDQWPSSIEKRFDELGDALAYRTFYARMSSETHGDAEETLRYFVGQHQKSEIFEAMALETIWNTRLYLYYAVASFLRASALYCDKYRIADTSDLFRMLVSEVQDELEIIARHTGSRLDSEQFT